RVETARRLYIQLLLAAAPAWSGCLATAIGHPPTPASLSIPRVIDLPYVVAGQGGSQTTVELENRGELTLTGPGGGPLIFSLSGDPALSLLSAPSTLPPGGKAGLTVAYAGAASESIASAVLQVEMASGSLSLPVYAVAGDPALPQGSFEVLS